MSDTPTDWLSYADWLGLNQDDIEAAQQQAFSEAEQAAGEANRLGFDLGIEQQSAGGQYEPQQSVTYGQFMEQQRKARDLAARATAATTTDVEMSGRERAARGLVAATNNNASTERTANIETGLKKSAQWIDSQRAIGQRNTKNVNFTRDRLAGYAASRAAAGPENDARDQRFASHYADTRKRDRWQQHLDKTYGTQGHERLPPTDGTDPRDY